MATEDRPGAQQWVPERPTMTRLREAVQDCRGCELYRDATQAVLGEGSASAEVMVLGEQPGDKEDLAGEPFVGPAGKVLDRALEESGLPPQDVFRTNVVKHFRFSGTRGKRRIHKSPSRWHVTACGPWLVAELAVVKPKGVIVLGGTAGKALYGSSFRVGESRGRLIDWPEAFEVAHPPSWVLTTTHPSAVLRADDRDGAYEGLVSDLRVAVEALAR
ncbi:MAG TPA: UdgX family uracil-DNA binding protein [Nocardioides sp.]|nr:UdgX family uracil-DNA binding protein [Nocardioides sp.]